MGKGRNKRRGHRGKASGGILNKIFLISIFGFLTLGLLIPESFAGTLVSSWQGYYVSRVDRTEGASVLVEVDVFPAYEGQAMFIDFMVTRKQPGQTLGAVSAATNMNQKQFTFSFTDALGNKGRGIFSRRGKKYVLHLEPVQKGSPAAKVSNLYGDHNLEKKSAKARPDRHPWSLQKGSGK